jgi:hypothetical protein
LETCKSFRQTSGEDDEVAGMVVSGTWVDGALGEAQAALNAQPRRMAVDPHLSDHVSAFEKQQVMNEFTLI